MPKYAREAASGRFSVCHNIIKMREDYLTLILIVAFLPDPSVALAVMVTVPFLPLTALTLPVLLTVAIFVLLDVQVRVLFALPFMVVTFAFTFAVLPALSVLTPESVIFFTEPFIQVRVIFPYFLLPSLAVAVMVTFFPPAFLLKVTTPLELTVATLVLLDFHVTALFVALDGATATFSCTFLPAAMLRAEAVTLTFVTLTTALETVILHVAFTFPAVAVITAVPSLTAVTTPSADTVATFVLLEVHTTASVVSAGVTVAANVTVLPSVSFWLVALRVIAVAGT